LFNPIRCRFIFSRVAPRQRSFEIDQHSTTRKEIENNAISTNWTKFFFRQTRDRPRFARSWLTWKKRRNFCSHEHNWGLYDDQAETRFFTEFKRDPTTRNAKIDAGFIAFNGEATRIRHDGCQRLRTTHATKAAC
jgi:hypothetical protein